LVTSLPLAPGSMANVVAEIGILMDTGATHSFIDRGFLRRCFPDIVILPILMKVKAAGSTLTATAKTPRLTVTLGETLQITTVVYILDNLPFPIILGNNDLGTAGIFTMSGRSNIFYWPTDGSLETPVDTGITLIAERPVQCRHACELHGVASSVIELAPYSPTVVWTHLPALHSSDLPLGSPLHVLRAGDGLILESLDLMEGVARLERDLVNPDQLGCWLEVYNNRPEAVVLPLDTFVARIQPLHTCGGVDSHCHIPPEYQPGSYVDPYYRFTEGLVFTPSAHPDDPHHYTMAALHTIDDELGLMYCYDYGLGLTACSRPIDG